LQIRIYLCVVWRRDGLIAHSALAQIWKPPAYPPELHEFLLSLLERFEIIFPVQNYAHKLGTSHQQRIALCALSIQC
jgi:hypothetical protein